MMQPDAQKNISFLNKFLSHILEEDTGNPNLRKEQKWEKAGCGSPVPMEQEQWEIPTENRYSPLMEPEIERLEELLEEPVVVSREEVKKKSKGIKISAKQSIICKQCELSNCASVKSVTFPIIAPIRRY